MFIKQPENVANPFESCRSYQIIVFCIYRFKKTKKSHADFL